MSDWTEVEVGHERVRYRRRANYERMSGWAFELEYQVGGQWRPVRNWNSRDWFSLGFAAGQSAPVQEAP